MLTETFDLWGIESRWVQLDELSSPERLLYSSWLTSINVLRVTVDFNRASDLKLCLESLSALLDHQSLSVCLVQIKYCHDTLSAKARKIHEQFLISQPSVSSYLPLCLPPSPLGAQAKWANPDNCRECIFLEAKSCAGLTGDEAKYLHGQSLKIQAGGALQSVWPVQPVLKDFQVSPPLCYWWPEDYLVDEIKQIMEHSHCKTLWDLGGGNGFLAWRFSDEMTSLNEAICIDPVVNQYPVQDGVKHRAMTAEEAMNQALSGHLTAPDVIIISWPSPGVMFKKVIETLQPKVIIRATDGEGVCGVRKGHRAAMISIDKVRIFGLAEGFSNQGQELDELDPLDGYQIAYENSVWCYRDFQLNSTQASGLLKIFKRI